MLSLLFHQNMEGNLLQLVFDGRSYCQASRQGTAAGREGVRYTKRAYKFWRGNGWVEERNPNPALE